LLSRNALAHATAGADISSNGVVWQHLSPNHRKFTYTLTSGAHVMIQVIGVGNLGFGKMPDETFVDTSGALHLVYGGTNAYSKIVGQVQGGGGQAPLASILNSQLIAAAAADNLNSQLIAAGAANNISGVGGNVLASVLLSQFNLIPGGVINLTSG